MLKRIVITGYLMLMLLTVCGQEDEDSLIQNVFKGTRLINDHSANVTETGELYL
jgi:hypothetical protein